MTIDDLTQTRIAENESAFRMANEHIEAAAENLNHSGKIPFLCECPDRSCTAIVALSSGEYEEVRSNPRRFFTAPGHEAMSIANDAGVLVEEFESHSLVEKIGVAGAIAARRLSGPQR